MAVISSRHDGARAESQRGQPRPAEHVGRLVENLIPDPEGRVHQTGCLLYVATIKRTPADRRSADVHIRRPFIGKAVIEREITLAHINAVILSARSGVGRHPLVAHFPNVVGLGLLYSVPKINCPDMGKSAHWAKGRRGSFSLATRFCAAASSAANPATFKIHLLIDIVTSTTHGSQPEAARALP